MAGQLIHAANKCGPASLGDRVTSHSRSARRSSRVSLRDVAQRAGVAASTVSRALSNHPDVSPDTHQRVMAAVEELGYRPNVLGQMLRQGATRTVGFSIGDISNPLFAEIALGAEATLSEHGYSLLLSNSMSNLDQELRNLQVLEQRRVDGLLLSVTAEDDPRLLATLERFDGPMVAIDRDIAADFPVASVYSDHRAGIAEAVNTLHRAGHRRIALIAGLAELRPGRQRAAAARQTAEKLGMRCDVHSSPESTGPATEILASLLLEKNRPTALIAGNNQILTKILEVLDKVCLSYPADISLVTCDEVPLLRFFRPTIATIRRDPHQLGQKAADLLLDQLLNNDRTARSVELPTSFSPGESICTPPKQRASTKAHRT